jgi:hypothetical protein
VYQAAIGVHEAQVAGEIEALIPTRRVGQEFRLREVRLAPVAEGEIATPDGDFPYAIEANLLSGIIEHQDLDAIECIADRHPAPGDVGRMIEKVVSGASGFRDA